MDKNVEIKLKETMLGIFNEKKKFCKFLKKRLKRKIGHSEFDYLWDQLQKDKLNNC